MRIALALEYPLQQRGGVEALVRALIDGLHARHELFLVSPDELGELGLTSLEPGIRCHFCWNRESPPDEEVARLIKWAKYHEIQVMHFHSGGTYNWNARSWSQCPITLVGRSGIRCMTTNHQAVSPFDVNRASESLLRRLLSFLRRWPAKARQLASVEHEFMVSRHDLSVARAGFPGFRHKMKSIYHSLLWSSSPPLPQSEDSKVILNLATVAFRKGQHVLAEAFAKIASEFPDWKLQLVGYHAGDGCRSTIEEIVRQHGLAGRVLMPGPTDAPEAAIAGAAIYVQPSLLEGLGLSLQEAQFHERACIGTRVGGIPELIVDGLSGLLVEPDDPASLAEAMRRLISDLDLRRRLGREGRSHVIQAGMTRESMFDVYDRLYAE